MPSRAFASVFGPIAQREPENYGLGQVPNRDANSPSLPRGLGTKLSHTLYHQWHVKQEDWHQTQARCKALMLSTLDWFEKDLSWVSQTTTQPMQQRESEVKLQYAACLPSDYFVYVMTQILVDLGWDIVGVGYYPSPADVEEIESRREHVQWPQLSQLYDLVMRMRDLGLQDDRLAIAYAGATDTLMHFYAKDFIESTSWTNSHGRKESEFDWAELEMHFIQDFSWGLAEMMRPIRTLRADVLALNPQALGRQFYRDRFDSVRHAPGVRRITDLAYTIVVKIMAKDLYDNIDGEVITKGLNFTDDTHIEAIATMERRGIMTVRLGMDVKERLLQPEVSTVRIIDFYVKLINQVGHIDNTGLLLDSVTGQLRHFLRTRDDVVRIVVTSLLDPAMTNGQEKDAVESTEDYSGQVARLMQQYISEAEKDDKGEFWPGKDLDDPNWTPAPMGAGIGFYKTRFQDAMGHMITLKNQGVFAEELRTILQERLLQTDAEHFDREERLVAMFQLRFSDVSIVQCEIMLRDIRESRRIHRDRSARITRILQAKILSRSIWPEPEEISFTVPAAMQTQTDQFSEYYAVIKPARSLKWQLSRCKVVIELNFDDRTFKEEVTAAQAAVINEFAEIEDDNTMQEDRATRTFAQLRAALVMDNTLLRPCLSFWVSKRVLFEHAPALSSYSVIESLDALAGVMLPNQADRNAQEAAMEAAQAAQEEPEEELLTALEQMNADKDYLCGPIDNMLRNQGTMPTTSMYMFMKMVTPDGFPYEEEDFLEFLKGLEKEGLVTSAGGMWQMPESDDDDDDNDEEIEENEEGEE